MNKITIDRATVEQALEALVVYSIKAEHKRTHADNCQAEEVTTALRQALEQPAQQQEPVAWMVRAHGAVQRIAVRADVADELACKWRESDPAADVTPLYTQPQVIDKSAAIRIATALAWEPKLEWVGLTEEEVDELQSGLSASHADVRAIEAKLKDKNT